MSTSSTAKNRQNKYYSCSWLFEHVPDSKYTPPHDAGADTGFCNAGEHKQKNPAIFVANRVDCTITYAIHIYVRISSLIPILARGSKSGKLDIAPEGLMPLVGVNVLTSSQTCMRHICLLEHANVEFLHGNASMGS